MRLRKLPLIILIALLINSNVSFSQSKRFFAVTGDQFGSTNWIVFRQMDLSGKTPVRTIYTPAESNEVVYDAVSNEKIINDNTMAAAATGTQTCGCLNKRMVAAIALDAKDNRLYYTSMLGNQLRYLDLNSAQPKSYVVTSQLLKNFTSQPGEASVITRMCFASDGYGYALTNDNEHLIRFSTGKQTDITDLGKLADAKSNGENSIKQQYKSWGGDMIADASGNLYLFAMQRDVYKINPQTRLAEYIGTIKNLPEDYTINAAMVENSTSVIVGSSTKTTGYYRVNLNTLEAAAINKSTDKVYNVSDFANANLAFSNNKLDAVAKTVSSNLIKIYPNPVSDKKINFQFADFIKGKYIIQISDMQGKTILQKELTVEGAQTESIMVSSVAAGIYTAKILNGKGEIIFTDKVVISK